LAPIPSLPILPRVTDPAPAKRARTRRPLAGESVRERNKREKRERLIRAARELFVRKGFEATTAREICRRAGVGTGTLFLYVKNKRDLLFLVFREEARRLWRETLASEERSAPIVDAASKLFGAFIEYYDSNPALAEGLGAQLLAGARGSDELVALNAEFLAHLVALIERAQERGELRSDRPASTLAALFFAHYEHWVLAWLVMGSVPREVAQAGLREALELQVEGLCPGSRLAAREPKPPQAPSRRS
jgi:AcrR family transcriptional regulator